MENNSKILFFVLLIVVLSIVVYYNLGIGIKNITKFLPKHPTERYENRKLSQIQEVVIHHTDTDSKTTKIKNVAKYHINKRGWAGIGYHFMVNWKGEIFQVNKLTTRSNQCGGCNTKTIGICLIGNFNTEEPTEKALKAVARTIKYVNRRLGRSLAISAHYDHKSTSCPGDHTNMDKIIEMVYPMA